jgi:hypothetical protein
MKTATQYVNYDKLFVTFDEPTEEEEKVDKPRFKDLSTCTAPPTAPCGWR